MSGFGKFGLKAVQRRSNISGVSPKKQDEEPVEAEQRTATAYGECFI
jgi:hypothetical protein